jgi:hypothetical protein
MGTFIIHPISKGNLFSQCGTNFLECHNLQSLKSLTSLSGSRYAIFQRHMILLDCFEFFISFVTTHTKNVNCWRNNQPQRHVGLK